MKQQSLGLGQSTKRTRRLEFLSEKERVVPWLEKHKLVPDVLKPVNDLLRHKGLLLKAGTVVDATHPFRAIKRQFSHLKVRYRGLAKNTAQVHMLFALANLWMARQQLAGTRA